LKIRTFILKLGLACAAVLFLTPPTVCQPQILWNRTLGKEGADSASYIVASGDEGFLVCGMSDSHPAVWKIDPTGNLEWQWTYQTHWFGHIYAAAPSTDDAFIIVAAEDWPNTGGSLILKIDREGNEIWRVAYGGRPSTPYGMDWAERGCITPTADGGFVLAGEAYYVKRVDPNGGTELTLALTVLKLGADGRILWNRSYPDERTLRLETVLEVEDGNILALSRGYLFKTDSRGNKIWTRSYTTGPENLCCMARTIDGYIVASGYTYGRAELVLMEIDRDGNKVWQRYHWVGGGYLPSGMAPTEDGGLVIVGDTKPYDDRDSDMFVLKVDREGEKEWLMLFGGRSRDKGGWAVPDGDGGFAVVGTTNSWGAGEDDVLVLRTEGRLFEDLTVYPGKVVPGLDNTLQVHASLRSSAGGWGSVDAVWADLSQLAIPEAVTLFDDGSPLHGDARKGDRVFSARVQIGPDLPCGRRSIAAHLVDRNGRSDIMTGYVFVYPVSGEIVYAEGSEDWSPMPESAFIDLRCNSPTYGGNASMRISGTVGGYVQFVPPGSVPVHTFGYRSIDLALNPGDCVRFYPRIYLGVEGEGMAREISLLSIGLTFQRGNWTYVSVPLESLDAVNMSLTFIRIGGYFDSSFYLDDLRIVQTLPDQTALAVFAVLYLGVMMLVRMQLLAVHHDQSSDFFSQAFSCPSHQDVGC